jgi:23S rRNA (guanosine2251-2'-O)-methyltransferase
VSRDNATVCSLIVQRVLVGFHAVTARLRHAADSVLEIYVQEGRRDPRLRELAQLAAQCKVSVLTADGRRLDGMAGGAHHQGVVALVEEGSRPSDVQEVLEKLAEPAFLLLLDGVTDPHNLGACLRTADAMGVHAVVVPKDRSAGVTATVAKAASGALESVPLITVTNLARTMQALKEAGVWLYGAAEEGKDSLLGIELEGPVAWVLGAEGQGLRRLTRENCDALVSIPMFGHVESLNVSVAAALCLYETRRQREARVRDAPKG